MQGADCYKAIAEQEALTSFVREHAALVKKIALQIKNRIPQTVELDDLYQSGITGLLEARNTYSEAENTAFSTWAWLKIQCAMFDFLRKSTGMTRDLSQNIKKVEEARTRLEHTSESATASHEVAKALGMTSAEFSKISTEIGTYKAISAQESEICEDIPCERTPSPLDCVESDKNRQTLRSLIEALPRREQIVLGLYYNEELSFREIGEVLDLTEARISQLHSGIIQKMRRKLQARDF